MIRDDCPRCNHLAKPLKKQEPKRTDLVCPRCKESFGSSLIPENVINWVRHLFGFERMCHHDIMRYMNNYQLPPDTEGEPWSL